MRMRPERHDDRRPIRSVREKLVLQLRGIRADVAGGG